MISRRKFLVGLAAVPFVPQLLRGMSWAAPAPAEAAARGAGGYSATVPAGTILPWAGKGAPPGFLPCDGRAVPMALYPSLHAAIGDAFGHKKSWRFHRFHVPDLQGRTVASSRPVSDFGSTFGEALRNPAAYEATKPPPVPLYQWVIRT